MEDIAGLSAGQPPLDLDATGLRSLGRGVAVSFAAPRLVALRHALMRDWRDWLTPQDLAPLAPHVTIQNKVAPAEARRLLSELGASFRPFVARGEGLLLWRYLGGRWELRRRTRFTGPA